MLQCGRRRQALRRIDAQQTHNEVAELGVVRAAQRLRERLTVLDAIATVLVRGARVPAERAVVAKVSAILVRERERECADRALNHLQVLVVGVRVKQQAPGEELAQDAPDRPHVDG